MKTIKLFVAILISYLVIFAAFSLHRTTSGYRRPFSFRRIRPVKKEIYQDIGNEHKLTKLITNIFSVKSPSEPD
jgi:hypothetical protein